MLLAVVGLIAIRTFAADGSNADERTLVPSLSYDGAAGAVTNGGRSDGVGYTGAMSDPSSAYCTHAEDYSIQRLTSQQRREDA